MRSNAFLFALYSNAWMTTTVSIDSNDNWHFSKNALFSIKMKRYQKSFLHNLLKIGSIGYCVGVEALQRSCIPILVIFDHTKFSDQ